MSFTRTESERLARLKGCTTGIYCRYGRPTGGITGPTGPSSYSFFTLGGNQSSLTSGTGSIIVVNTTGPTGTISYSNILQASNTGYTGSSSPYLKVGSDIIPDRNNIYSIGSRDMQFKSAYFGANTVYIDGVPIGSTGGSTIVMPSRMQIGQALLTASGDTLVLPANVRLGSLDGPILGATGPTGPGGSSGSGGDNMDWINKHLLGAAPLIEFETPVEVRSSEIFIGWKYPEQVKLSFVNVWVPAIFGFTSSVEFHTNGISSRQTEKMKVANSNDIDAYNYLDVNGTRYVSLSSMQAITGIILTNESADSNKYIPNYVWPSGGSRNIYRYYHPNFENLDPTDLAKIIVNIAYTNLSTESVNSGSITVDLFVGAGPPSEPQNLLSRTINATTVDISFNHPEFEDAQNPGSKSVIEKYKVSYSTTGSTRRYGGPVSQISSIIETQITYYNKHDNIKYTYGALYPESMYTFEIRAVNTAIQIDGSSAFIDVSTGILPPLINLDKLALPNTQFYGSTIKRVRDGALITHLLNTPPSGQVYTTAYTIPIHQVSTRGFSEPGLAVATVELVGGPTASITYGGFGYTQPIDIENNRMRIIVDKYKDKYTEQAQQGFYMYADQIARIDISGNIQPSADPYRLVFTQANYDGVSQTPIFEVSTLSAIDQSVYEFYYDTPSVDIDITDISWTLFNSDSISVCGVLVMGNSYTLNVITKLNNYDNYFYISPFLEYYNTANTLYANETSVNGILNITDKLSGELNIYRTTTNNKALVGNIPSGYYSKELGFRVKAHNLHKTTISPETFINIIIDKASYDLLTSNKYPVEIQHFNSTFAVEQMKSGCRIISGASRGGTQNPYVSDFTADISSIFNNTTSIKDTEELQIFKGKYRANSITGNTDGYIDYRPYINNSVDYSHIDISGYRFATFRWDLDSLPPGLEYYNLRFTLYNTECITIDSLYKIARVNSDKLLLYYRFIEEPNMAPTSYDSLTTSWVNGNYQLPELTSGSFIVPPDNSYTLGGLLDGPIFNASTKDMIFNERMHVPTSHKMTLICRVGLPMGTGAAFEYITASFNIS